MGSEDKCLVLCCAHSSLLPDAFLGSHETKRLTLRSPPCTPRIPPHRYRFLVIDYIAQICQRALEFPAIDSLCGFAGVFEGDAEVGAVGAGGFALLDCRGCVADL